MAVQEHMSESNTSAAVELKPNHHVWTPGQELAAKLVFGGTGCTIAVVFTHPVDVIKTRLQLQGEAGTPHQPSSSTPSSIASSSLAARKVTSPSTALLSSGAASHLAHSPTVPVSTNTVIHRDAALLVHDTMRPNTATASLPPTAVSPKTLRLVPLLREIMRTEGPRVLTAGLAPAVLRESTYSTIRLGSYDFFKGIYSGMGTQMRGGEETSTLVKLAAGLTSGMIGSGLANPTDLIKGTVTLRSRGKIFFSFVQSPISCTHPKSFSLSLPFHLQPGRSSETTGILAKWKTSVCIHC
jgi:solute carrier family 25 protein 14/30